MNIPAVKPDQRAIENECRAKKLKKVCIFQLKRDEIEKDTVLWVKICKVQTLHGYIEMIVEDDAGQCILLAVYNQPGTTAILHDANTKMKRDVLEDKFVKHTFRERWEIGIKQPYMVLSG